MYKNICDLSYENGYMYFRSSLPESYKLGGWLQDYSTYWKEGQAERLCEIEKIIWSECGYI